MDKEHILGKMVHSILVNGMKIVFMEKENIHIQTEIFIMVNGKME